MFNYLLTPERYSYETMEQYRQRRNDAKKYAYIVRYGVMPTIFVQHRPNQLKKEQQ